MRCKTLGMNQDLQLFGEVVGGASILIHRSHWIQPEAASQANGRHHLSFIRPSFVSYDDRGLKRVWGETWAPVLPSGTTSVTMLFTSLRYFECSSPL